MQLNRIEILSFAIIIKKVLKKLTILKLLL